MPTDSTNFLVKTWALRSLGVAKRSERSVLARMNVAEDGQHFAQQEDEPVLPRDGIRTLSRHLWHTDLAPG